MGARGYVYFYSRRLRVHAGAELLAALGVAVAVALVFAVLVGSSSISSSTDEVVHTLVGPASLQVRARGEDGFDERVLLRVQRLPGVEQAAPILEVPATIVGPNGRRVPIGVAGARASLALLDGLAHTIPLTTLAPGRIALAQSTATATGLRARSAHAGGATGTAAAMPSRRESPTTNGLAMLDIQGMAVPVRVAAVLGSGQIGALAQARVAIMPLANLQRLAGLRGRLTRILVKTAPAREAAVRAELERVAGGRLDVTAADQEIELLGKAVGPGDQASEFFAAVAVLLGFLFALDAMLLTVPERRRAIVDLRLLGAERGVVVRMVLFEAVCLGVGASLVGMAGGYGLSVGFLHQSPDYLARTFTLGNGTVIGAKPLLLAPACGIAAACLAAVVPLLDVLRGGGALDPVHPGGQPNSQPQPQPQPRIQTKQPNDQSNATETELNRPSRFLAAPATGVLAKRAQVRLLAATIGVLGLTTVWFFAAPTVPLAIATGLALGTVLAVPVMFGMLLAGARALLRRRPQLSTLALALASLRSATLRSLVLAATGAVALFGSFALGGANADLLQGVESYDHDYVGGAPIWVTAPGDYEGIVSFPVGSYPARIARVSGVRSVRPFYATFVTLGDRRVWVTARPLDTNVPILQTQIVSGDARTARARLGAGGWIVLARQVAEEDRLGVGDTLTLPTPAGPQKLRIAALSTNFGWAPGTIMMSPADYVRDWGSSAPTALMVGLAPSANNAAVRGAIARALGPHSGLQVVSTRQREAEVDAALREGLSRLTDISTLLVVAAILALATALISAIRQRRELLSELRLTGARPRDLRVMLLIETALTLTAGCLAGMAVGVYGQTLIDGYLARATGYPVASPAANAHPLVLLAVVLVAVLVIVAIPGRRASRVSPTLALEM